jgi:hypothetical protein
MAMKTAVEDHEVERAECWCCGTTGESNRMVHLGNHPEVTLCVRCGYWAAKQAWHIEDRSASGPAVQVRNGLRQVRRSVIEHGWQHNRFVGGPLRWIGKRLP